MAYTAPELVLIIGSIGTTIVSIITAIMVQRVHRQTNSNYTDLKADNTRLQMSLDSERRQAMSAEEARRILAAEAARVLAGIPPVVTGGLVKP